jgi:hypothetical protein
VVPGFSRKNYFDAFRDSDGNLSETDEFFEIGALYGALERVAESKPALIQ